MARWIAGRQAKILTENNVNDLLIFAATTRRPLRNQLIVRLSAKAGLRAGEIANLTWDMVLNPAGDVGAVIELRDWAAKKRSGRLIPIHPSLRDDLLAWRQVSKPCGPLITSERGGGMTPVSIVNWFASAYRAIGVSGCSSHSGRRTFITRAAPPVARSPASSRSLSATLFWPRLVGSCGLARTFDGKNVSILVALMGVAHRLLDRSCLCAAGSPSDGDGGNRHYPYFAHRFRTLARTWRRGVALADHGTAPRPRRGHPNPYSACRGMDPS